MNSNNQENGQEIDLVFLFKKIKELFIKIELLIYKSLRFLIKNIVYFITIILIGAGLGYFIERNTQSVKESVITVIPNFGSADYLYNELEVINQTKNSIKLNRPEIKDLIDIKIEPVYELNDLFISKNNNDLKQDFLKTFFENSDKIKKEMSDDKLKSIYKTHLITIKTKESKNTKKIIEYVFNRLNTNKYYLEKGNKEKKMLLERNELLKNSIYQIDKILNNLGENSSPKRDEKGVNISTYNEIGRMLDQKNEFMTELSINSDKIIESKSTIFTLDSSINMDEKKDMKSNYKLILPILFLLFFLFLTYYKYLKNKFQ
ncbi:hypothetical protein [Empedobacter sp.]|uniref:hypothetical protein n=1 Tax=Empedobacter sp. TaxID=1927715 RepID=UPI0028A1A3DD|nr:hypothetical protein [Empedobacter sp.]